MIEPGDFRRGVALEIVLVAVLGGALWFSTLPPAPLELDPEPAITALPTFAEARR